jgi:hypothetical protein
MTINEQISKILSQVNSSFFVLRKIQHICNFFFISIIIQFSINYVLHICRNMCNQSDYYVCIQILKK